MPSGDQSFAQANPDVGRFPIWCGLSFRQWMRLLAMRPPVHWSKVGWLPVLTATSAANSVLGAVERAIYGRRVAATELHPSPIFILGHWRSGTTLLHNLLSADPQFTVPRFYQISFPGHFLLTERIVGRLTARWLPKTRAVDNMPLAWEAPSEDEFALLLETLYSPYLAPVFADSPERVERFDNIERGLSPAELERWKSSFIEFLKKVTFSDPGRLVLKSPAHTGRIPLLLKLFPDARFIYIVRDPYVVYSSTMHLQRVLLKMASFTRPTFAALEERVLSAYMKLYNAYHMMRALIKPERLYELRFESLQEDPLRELENIYNQFELPGYDAMRRRLEPAMAEHRAYKKNRYVLDEATRARVYEAWKPAFKRYGYPE